MNVEYLLQNLNPFIIILLMNITLVNSAWPTNKCFNLRFIFKYRYIFSKMKRWGWEELLYNMIFNKITKIILNFLFILPV